MKTVGFYAILLIALIGCSSKNQSDVSKQDRLLDSLDAPEHIGELENLTVITSETKPVSTIQFQEEQQFGEIYPQLMAPTRRSGPRIAVDQKGGVFHANIYEKKIHVYNPDGSKLTDIGREGKGPGEFMTLGISIDQNRLLVYDSSMLRIQIFNLNPIALSHTIKLRSRSWNKFDEVRSPNPNLVVGNKDSTFFTRVPLSERDGRSYYGYYKLGWDGNIISDKIVEQQRLYNYQWTLDNGMVGGKVLPFTSKDVVDFSSDGTIYHANTREFLIRIYNDDGDYQRAIYYPYERRPLDKEEALDLLFHPDLQSRIRNADFPDFWPALESIIVDDENRIWVSTIVDDMNVYEWWILDNSGKLLAKLTWPRGETIRVIKDGKIYVGIEDEENGARSIVRYRFEMKPIQSEKISN